MWVSGVFYDHKPNILGKPQIDILRKGRFTCLIASWSVTKMAAGITSQVGTSVLSSILYDASHHIDFVV